MKYVDEDETSTKEVDFLAPVVTENEIKTRKLTGDFVQDVVNSNWEKLFNTTNIQGIKAINAAKDAKK